MLSKALGVSLGIAVVVILFLFNQNGNLQEDMGKAKAAVTQAAQTNKNNLASIDDLDIRLGKCVRDREVDVAAGVAVVSALKADILTLEERGIEIRIEREEIFREPSCRELGEMDINAVCPDLATGLRDSADSLN